ncbi:MAG: orotidine-5'-phosphate decarboxylase [Hyphomicrobiales bacterium]|nr:orotidine-5'-phosphate decarboxylase [Hyphomicrobiales bacterium]
MQAPPLDPKDRLIVALDVASLAEAERLLARLGDAVGFYKIGYRLGFAGGLDLSRRLIDAGKQVFLDFKLHDIASTVKEGVASLASTGARFATVHAYPQTMQAALEGRGDSALGILAVTVLTSYDDDDLRQAGYRCTVAELARLRARQALKIGIDGLVCSPWEVSAVRALVGENMVLVTPGIRPAGVDAGDQKRIMTPAAAIAAGADYLVVGRPVVAAEDPRAAAIAIIADIAEETG